MNRSMAIKFERSKAQAVAHILENTPIDELNPCGKDAMRAMLAQAYSARRVTYFEPGLRRDPRKRRVRK